MQTPTELRKDDAVAAVSLHIILIPGFWLGGDSWSSVTTPMGAAGQTVHPLTLPGKESVAADRARGGGC